MNSGRSSAAASVATASVCAFAIIATQVAGKATRDALFLTHFHISTLPLILMASAVFSVGAVLFTARSISLFGPSRVIPPSFLVSGLLLIAEWLFAVRHPRPASVIIYLHIAIIGSILISGFWSMINEHFDPRTAKRSIGRIVGAATLGGLFGGVLAERVGATRSMLWVLPIVAGLHLFCAFLLPRLRTVDTAMEPLSIRVLFARSGQARATESGFRVLRRVGYLRNLALIVLLGNIAATLIDFLFKARAAQSYASGADLMRFFAVFYTAVSIVTLLVQTGMTRRLLERIGIANTMAIRPAVMTVGGLIALPVMGLAGLGILRGVEAVLQSSLFRSGYELLFTPVVPDDKRNTKTIIDVGADRMGDVLGGAIIRGVILLPVAFTGQILVSLAVAISLIGFIVARALRRGYIRALEESLRNRADVLDIKQDVALGMRTMMMESFTGVDLSVAIDEAGLSEIRRVTHASVPASDASATSAETAPMGKSSTRAAPALDPEVALLVELRSGDANRVHAALRQTRSLSPVVAAQIIPLLAWDEITGWASRALAKGAPAITGQLVDRLLDPNEDFAVRRRIPRILSTCATPRAYLGLLAALADKRFEVRFQCARAMARIHDQLPSIAIDRDAVYGAVLRETRIEKPLWDNQRLLDEPEPDDPAVLVDENLRVRTNRSMEHVFTILSLVLPRATLQIAFKGLLTNDAVLRGTSLEYMESVLPREIWDSLRPFLDDPRKPTADQRPNREILDDLLRSSRSIEVNLEEIRKHTRESGGPA